MSFLLEEGTKNTVQILTDICGEFKQVADTLRIPDAEGLENVVPDIFDLANKLITSIITCKTGYDPNIDILKKAADFDSELMSEEKKFVKKMEAAMNDLASKVDYYQEQLDLQENEFQKALKEIPIIFQNTLDKIDKQNERKLENYEKQLEQERIEYDSQEAQIKDQLKEEMEEHLKKLNEEWTQKIKDADIEVANLQHELHVAIHAKHEQNQSKLDEYKMLEKRNSQEIIDETEQFKKLKEKAENEIRDLTKLLDGLTQQAIRQNDLAKEEAVRLEEFLQKERLKIEEDYSGELGVLSEQLEKLNDQIRAKQNLIDSKRIDSTLQIREIEEQYETRLQEERNETKRQIDEAILAVENEYQPQIDMLNLKIHKAEEQRGIAIEDLHKTSITSEENGENEVIELNTRHQNERASLRAQIRKEKQELQVLLQERNKDIEEQRSNLERKLGETQKMVDEAEKEHQEDLDRVNKRFAELARQYEEDKQRRIEERDKRRVIELERLAKENTMRRNAIIFNFEQNMKAEAEKAYQAGVLEAAQQHQQEMAVLKGRITDYKNQLDAANSKLDETKANHENKLLQLEEAKNLEIQDKCGLLKADYEVEKRDLLELQKQLVMSYRTRMKKKRDIEAKIEEVNKKIVEIEEKPVIETPLDIIEQTFTQIIANLRKEETDGIIEQRQLQKQIKELQASIAHYTAEASDKEAQLKEFEETKNQRFNEYLEDTRRKLENEFDKEKIKPIQFEESLIPLRKELDEQIFKLEKEFAAKREWGEKTIDRLLQERDQMLADLEAQLQKDFENKMMEMDEEHAKLMKILDDDLEDEKNRHIDKMKAIHRKYDEDAALAEIKYIKDLDEVKKQKDEIEEQLKSIQNKLNEIGTPQCFDCNERRETIRRLSQRRAELFLKIDDTTAEINNTEQRITILTNPQRKGASTALNLNAQQSRSPSLTMPRPQSSARRTVK